MNPLPRLVVASANPDKVAEIALVLDGLVDLDPRPPDLPDVVEDGDTLEANARLKAVAICEATGRAAVADDTGLEVDSLGGAPGVHTGRYAGDQGNSEANMGRLLGDLVGVPPGRRTARCRTVALVQRPAGPEVDGGVGDDTAIVTGTVALAHSLGLRVIAAGVETESQLRRLQRLQCDMAQGFHFSEPVTDAEFDRFLGRRFSEAPVSPN